MRLQTTERRTVEDLRAELANKTREARVLQEFTSRLNSTLEPEQLFALLLATIDEVFGFAHSMVLLLEDETLRVVASRGYADGGIGATVSVGVGVIGVVAKKRKLMRMAGLRARRQLARVTRREIQAHGDTSTLSATIDLPGLVNAECQIAIPMLVAGTVVGVLAVESDAPQAFSKADEILVATLANQAATAIQNATTIATLEDRVRDRTRALEQAQVQLVHAGRMSALGTLVAGLAHEINTPIASVIASQELVASALSRLRRKDSVDARLLGAMGDATRTIEVGARRVSDIVTRLRSFARLDEAELLKVDLNAAIDDILELMRHEVPEGVEVEVDHGDLPLILCHARQLNQVFVNLLLNALQANASRVEILTRHEDERAVVTIRDDGCGISPEHLEAIFDPGFTTKGVGVGLGLGLAIADRVVRAHAGEIRVTSELERGTSFRVALPVD